MTKPYIAIIDAIQEYRNDHIDRPDVIYVGTQFMERLKSSDDIIPAAETDEDGVRVAGVEVREDPSITGVRIPDESFGLGDLYP